MTSHFNSHKTHRRGSSNMDIPFAIEFDNSAGSPVSTEQSTVTTNSPNAVDAFLFDPHTPDNSFQGVRDLIEAFENQVGTEERLKEEQENVKTLLEENARLAASLNRLSDEYVMLKLELEEKDHKHLRSMRNMKRWMTDVIQEQTVEVSRVYVMLQEGLPNFSAPGIMQTTLSMRRRLSKASDFLLNIKKEVTIETLN